MTFLLETFLESLNFIFVIDFKQIVKILLFILDVILLQSQLSTFNKWHETLTEDPTNVFVIIGIIS